MNGRRLTSPLLLATLAASLAGCAIDSRTISTTGGGGGVAPGNPVVGGVVQPAPGGGAGGDPSSPTIEVPVAGQLDPSPVSVWKLEPTIDGRHVTVLLSWWSGPAPCFVLDSVEVVRDGNSITLTPREGADPRSANGAVACPAIALLRGTIVDLGELEPGTWTLAPHGDLAPVPVTIE